eukprot:scaffold618598_cov34-Prasinocladus_malaysianus.AAC.1
MATSPPATPMPLPEFEPGNYLLYHMAVFEFVIAEANQLQASGVSNFVQQYLQFLAATFGEQSFCDDC